MATQAIDRRRQRLEKAQADAAAKLAAAERAFYRRWWALAIAGAAVTLLATLLIAGMFYVGMLNRLGHARVGGFWFFALKMSGLVIPILLLLATAMEGSVLERYAEETSDMSFYPGRGRAGAGIVLLEVCLWGPRMIISALRRTHEARKVAGADRAVAACMVATLFVEGEGMSTGQLLLTAAPDADRFGDALAYLIFHEWVGVSSDGARAWLASDARAVMEASR